MNKMEDEIVPYQLNSLHDQDDDDDDDDRFVAFLFDENENL